MIVRDGHVIQYKNAKKTTGRYFLILSEIIVIFLEKIDFAVKSRVKKYFVMKFCVKKDFAVKSRVKIDLYFIQFLLY